MERFWFKFLAHFMQVELLLSKLSSCAARAKVDTLYPKHLLIKSAGCLEVLNSEHDMIKMIDRHRQNLLHGLSLFHLDSDGA